MAREKPRTINPLTSCNRSTVYTPGTAVSLACLAFQFGQVLGVGDHHTRLAFHSKMPSRVSKLMARMSTRMSAEMTLVTAFTRPTSSMPLNVSDAHLKLRGRFARPVCLHHAVSVVVTRQKVGGVGAVPTVDLDAAADRDEPKHVVPRNGVAACGQSVVEFLFGISNQQDITGLSSFFEVMDALAVSESLAALA